MNISRYTSIIRKVVLTMIMLFIVSGVEAADYVFFSNGHFLGVSDGTIAAPTTFDKESCVWTTTATAGGSGTFSVTVSGTTYYLTSSIGVSTSSDDAATFYLSTDGRQVSTASDAGYLQYNSSAWDAEGSAADNAYELKGIVEISWQKQNNYYLAVSTNSYYNDDTNTPYLITSNGTAQEWAILKYDSDYSFLLHLNTSKFVIANSTAEGDKAVHLETVTTLGTAVRFKIGDSNGQLTIIPNGSLLGFNSYGGAGKTIGLYKSSDAGSKWYMINSETEKPTITIGSDKKVNITTNITGGLIFYTIVTSVNGQWPSPNSTQYTAPFDGTTGTYIIAMAYDPATGYCSEVEKMPYFKYDTAGKYVVYNNGHFLGITDGGELSNSITTYDATTCRWTCDDDGFFSITKGGITYYLTNSGGTLSVSTDKPATGFYVDQYVRLCTTITDGICSGYVQYSDGTWNANGSAQQNCYMSNENDKIILWTSNTAYGLAPSTNYYAEGMPYLKTSNATPYEEWVFLKEYDPAYTYIINKNSGQFIVANATTNVANAVHLECPKSLDNARFIITTNNGISFISKSTDVSFNSYSGAGNNIGFYKNDNGSRWNIIDATPPTPEITIDLAGNVTITCSNATASIYYTTDGTDPTSSSTAYTATFSVESGTTVKAIAINNGLSSEIASETYTVQTVATPAISIAENGTVTISCDTEGASIYYTTNGDDPTSSSTPYSEPFVIEENVTVKAIAIRENMNNSAIASATNTVKTITSLSQITESGGRYKLGADIDAGGFTSIESFSGTLEGNFHTISNLSVPIFKTASGAKIKNVILDNVQLTSALTVNDTECLGAIVAYATGSTKIYNCGILSKAGTSSISGGDNTGSIAGYITGDTRVINNYSYANVSGGSYVGGIVGHVAGTALTKDNYADNAHCAVMNNIFYGNLSGTSNVSPVYAGNHTSNVQNVNEYNFWRSKATVSYNNYNDQLAIDKDIFLNRFPFYRHILNTHRDLAAIYLYGTVDKKNEIAHWYEVKNDDAIPYPILETWQTNTKRTTVDIKNNLQNTTEQFAGKLLNNIGSDGYYTGSGNLVENMGSNGYLTVNYTIGGTSGSVDLPITDMDSLNYDFTWGKVVLPFANELWTQTDYSEVVTGWKITGVTGGTAGTLSNYNFADRDCTAKDIYNATTNPYIFAQGDNYIVPYGVTAINIEANFATAYYLSDAYYDFGYKADYSGTTNLTTTVPTTYHGQSVYTNLSTLLVAMSANVTTPHQQAIVLVGNFHYNQKELGALFGDRTKGLTIMSVDEDCNQEPDYGWYSYHTASRTDIPPMRFDFVPNIGMGMAARVTASTPNPSIGIWHGHGWFELTKTALSLMTEFEIDSKSNNANDNGYGNNRWIANSGYFEQIIRGFNGDCSKLSYVQIGGNAYVVQYYPSEHITKTATTTLRPTIVTGGEIVDCYMTGNHGSATGDNIYFWCAGGRIHKYLSAFTTIPNEKTSGHGVDVTAKIDHARIYKFFGGGTSTAARITGNINVTINNSLVDFYCGGPEFGNMSSGKTVTTNAIGTTFGQYYGAGFGGTSLSLVYITEEQNFSFGDATNTYPLDFSNYKYLQTKDNYGLGVGYAFDFFLYSGGVGTGVARIYTKYARFSLATTGNVTNTLSHCKLLNDYYGAGCQGKVNGTVTSTLTGCEVTGSAFGGGYQASANTLSVYPNTQPTYSVYTKETGTFSDFGTVTPEEWHWEEGTVDTYSNTQEKPKTLFTDVNLTELGNVSGAISITVNGGTVGKDVFGGGNESHSLDNTTVTIQNGAAITHNVYGGGNLADVGAYTTSDGTNDFGTTGVCNVDITGGTIGNDVFGAGKGKDDTFECEKAMVSTTNVNISNGTVNGTVYGGGEIGRVENNTSVTIGEEGSEASAPVIKGDVFGAGMGLATHGYSALVRGNATVTIQGNAKVENRVFGGGMLATVGRYKVEGGLPTEPLSGGVCTVTIRDNAEIGPDGMKMYYADGKPDDTGHVVGAGRGILPYEGFDEEEQPWRMGADGNKVYYTSLKTVTAGSEDEKAYFKFIRSLGLASETHVTIGGNAFVKGSVYGGSMNGYVQTHTNVTIEGTCQIGQGQNGDSSDGKYTEDQWSAESTSVFHECASWAYDQNAEIHYVYDPFVVDDDGNGWYDAEKTKTANYGHKVPNNGQTFYGNVFAGGCGYYPFAAGRWLDDAGSVGGDATLTMTGGHVLTSVYGGNEMTDVSGNATVTISGGTIGVPRTEAAMIAHPVTCYVFGGGKGDQRTWFNTKTNIHGDATVTISGKARIFGSTFGGGEDGHVFGDVSTTINPDTEDATYPKIGSTGTSSVDGNIFGGGRGFSVSAYTAGSIGGNITTTINGGTMLGTIYGGGRLASAGACFVNPYLDDGATPNPLYGTLQPDTTETNRLHGHIAVNINGGKIGARDNSGNLISSAYSIGDVFGGCKGAANGDAKFGLSKYTEVTIAGGNIGRNVYGGGEMGGINKDTHVLVKNTISGENTITPVIGGNVYGGGMGSATNANVGQVHHNVVVDIQGGIIGKNVYGGGAIANTNIHDKDNPASSELTCKEECTTQVNLTGGLIKGDCYGGGEGVFWEPTEANKSSYMTDTSKPLYNQQYWNDDAKAEYAKRAAIVWGDVTVTLNGTAFELNTTTVEEKTIPTSGRIFGCNNINGTPKGTVLVHVKKTVALDNEGAVKDKPTKGTGVYELQAVYGGGNLAGYQPFNDEAEGQYTDGDHNATSKPTQVVIEGCDESSIEYVYGGGSAADVPATDVVILSAYEIGYAFGGGNGQDKIKPDGTNWRDNYGADVGRYWYSTEMGTGDSHIEVAGGTVHNLFAGSNTLGDIYGKTNMTVEQSGDCELCVDNIYNGGNEAATNGGSLVLGCVDYMKRLYAGSNAADINGDVEVTVTSGRFDQVFAGNNKSGVIRGSLTINIEETGCNPIIIGELYGGGNNAPYSVYGYNSDGSCRTKAEFDAMTDEQKTAEGVPYNNPVINIKSFTSIGKVYGAGRGAAADVYGSPVVNINEVKGKFVDTHVFRTGEDVSIYLGDDKEISVLNTDGEATETLDMPTFNVGAIGGIGFVYGGGNAADVFGNTTVNICTESSVTYKSGDKAAHGVEGADIRYNVYGGGNVGSVGIFTYNESYKYADEFITDSITVSKAISCAEGTGICTVNIKGNAEIGLDDMKMTAEGGPDDYGMVFGAGKGEVAENNPIPYQTYVDSTNVIIGGNAFIKGSVYGGSEDGNVLRNTHVTIQDNCQIGNGFIPSTGKGLNRRYTDTEWASGHLDAPVEGWTLNDSLPECASWPYGKQVGDSIVYLTHDKYAIYDGYYDQAKTHYAEGASNSASDGHTFYGNVFGGGAGYHPYAPGKWLLSAGKVEGNTLVDITGGHILTSVYGGNEMTDVWGNCTVKMIGGTLGVPRTLAEIAAHPVTCYLFGGGKGDHRTFFNKSSDIENAIVNISGGTIYGSVFGGAEDGHVLGNVTMEISGGTIGTWGTSYVDGNVFGGGRGFSGDAQTAGTVGGNVKMTISGGTMLGSIYGGGRLGSVGTYFAMKTDTEHYGKMQPDLPSETAPDAEKTEKHGHITINISGGTIGNSYEYDYIAPETTIDDAYRTAHHIPFTEFLDNNHLKHTKGGNVFAGCMGRFYKLDGTTVMPIWHELAQVKKTKLTISGGTIKSNVYGGGELGPVMQNTEVNIKGGTIGTRIMNGETEDYTFGSVYGSGYGSDLSTVPEAMRWAGVVRGNTNVNISAGDILHNVYGGGELASVGTFTAGYTPETNYLPTVCTDGTGTATVNITDGTIGTNGNENGMVYGSSRGDIHPAGEYDRLAWVDSTSVTIGTTSGNLSTPLIKGSIYGSGENGHTLKNTLVTIHSGTIGIDNAEDVAGGARYPYRGNVYGGGCGTDTYQVTENEKTYTRYNPLSGVVMGNTSVSMDGGYVVHNIYGGGAMGSVGTFTHATTENLAVFPQILVGKPISCAEGTGKCTISVTGGEVGPDGMKMQYDNGNKPYDAGHVFGAGRGEVRDTTVYDNLTTSIYVNETDLTISGTAFVKGSVYGGAESGHVLGNTLVKIQGGQIGQGNGVTDPYTNEQFINPSTTAVTESNALTECASWDYATGPTAAHYVYDPFVVNDVGKYANATDGPDGNGDANGGRKIANNGQSFFGCVFGGGSGYYPYAAGKWLDMAGIVEGNTVVEMTGGHVLTNVYGGNEMTDVMGTATVTISAGTVGVPRTAAQIAAHPVTCFVFGGGRGDQRTWFNTKTNIHGDATVVVKDNAIVYGSIFGGGEDGHVFSDVHTTIGEEGDGSMPVIGTLGTTGVDGNVFGGGRGFSVSAYTAGSIGGNTNTTINSGTIMGNVYGGGRLASVGSWFVKPTNEHYGTLQDDVEDDPATTEIDETKTHGHIFININGGNIGAEGNSTAGNVFGGCKGVASSDNDEIDHTKFGIAKYTTINMTNGTVWGSIYGGGEAGNVLQDTNISITQPEGKTTIVKGNVYGGGSEAKVGGNTNVVVGQ